MLLGMIFEGNVQPHSVLQSPGRSGPGWMCQEGIAADSCEQLVIIKSDPVSHVGLPSLKTAPPVYHYLGGNRRHGHEKLDTSAVC